MNTHFNYCLHFGWTIGLSSRRLRNMCRWYISCKHYKNSFVLSYSYLAYKNPSLRKCIENNRRAVYGLRALRLCLEKFRARPKSFHYVVNYMKRALRILLLATFYFFIYQEGLTSTPPNFEMHSTYTLVLRQYHCYLSRSGLILCAIYSRYIWTGQRYS